MYFLVDCWDSLAGPVVYHGNTLTSKIPLQEVFETIQEFAFVTSPYVMIYIIIHNSCSKLSECLFFIINEMGSFFLFVDKILK